VYLTNAPAFNFHNYALLLQRIATDAAYRESLHAQHGKMAAEYHHKLRGKILHGDFHEFEDRHEILAVLTQQLADKFKKGEDEAVTIAKKSWKHSVSGVAGVAEAAMEHVRHSHASHAEHADMHSHLADVAGSVSHHVARFDLSRACTMTPNTDLSPRSPKSKRSKREEAFAIDREKLDTVRKLIIEEMASLKSYDGAEIDVEMLFESHLRCKRDLEMACRNFHANEDLRKKKHELRIAPLPHEEAANKAEASQHMLNSICKVQQENAVPKKEEDLDILKVDSGVELVEMIDDFEKEIDEGVEGVKLKHASFVETLKVFCSAATRNNGLALEMDRLQTSMLRSLKVTAAHAMRDTENIALDIADFIRFHHSADAKARLSSEGDSPQAMMDRAHSHNRNSLAEPGKNLVVKVVEATHLRDHSNIHSDDFAMMQCLVTTYILDRPLLDHHAIFRTPPSHPIHPRWDAEGILQDFRADDVLVFEVRDVDKQVCLGKAHLEQTDFTKDMIGEKHVYGFRGELLLEQDHDFFNTIRANAARAKLSVEVQYEEEESEEEEEAEEEDEEEEEPVAQESGPSLKQQIADLKLQIAEAERELEVMQRAVPLPRGLLTLRDNLQFTGDREPFLEVGKSIMGASQVQVNSAPTTTTTDVKAPGFRDVAVQTDPAVQEAADRQQRALDAEMLKLGFQQKEYDMKTEELEAGIKKLHEKIAERSTRYDM
jgi:hypothetical protein